MFNPQQFNPCGGGGGGGGFPGMPQMQPSCMMPMGGQPGPFPHQSGMFCGPMGGGPPQHGGAHQQFGSFPPPMMHMQPQAQFQMQQSQPYLMVNGQPQPMVGPPPQLLWSEMMRN